MLAPLNSVGIIYSWTNISTQFNEFNFMCKCSLWQTGICETHWVDSAATEKHK